MLNVIHLKVVMLYCLLTVIHLNVVMLSVFGVLQCHSSECRYAKCRGTHFLKLESHKKSQTEEILL
jgi:hypothetical protein